MCLAAHLNGSFQSHHTFQKEFMILFLYKPQGFISNEFNNNFIIINKYTLLYKSILYLK